MLNRTVIILLSLIIKLQADPVLPGVVAATDGDPSVMVGGCVNAITGDLVLGVQDLTVRGAVELPITRSYVSGDGGGCDAGWEFFFPHFQMCFYQDSANSYRASLSSPTGGKLRYSVAKYRNHWSTMEPVIERHATGMTNNSRGLLSGRTSSKNNRIYFKEEKRKRKEIHLITGEGLRYAYSSKISAISDEENDIYVLEEEQLQSGCWILYQHDKYGRPTEARVVNPQKNKTFSWARFHYIGDHSKCHDMWIETSDGRKIHYSFEKKRGKNKEDRFYLRDVTGDIQASEHSHFDAPNRFNPLLTHLSQGGKLLQKIVHQYRDKTFHIPDDDERCGRVKELWSPSGPEGKEICTHQFTYPKIHWHRDMRCCKKDGSTWVNGPHGYKAEYRWTRELRPKTTLLFDTDQSSQPCIIYEYVWEPEATPRVGDLLIKRVREGNGKLLAERRYFYDGRFNPVTETFYGNLTGRSEEGYTRRHAYSNDDRNLLVETREDNGRTTRYSYMPGSSLLTAVLVGDEKKIGKRDFYEYNADHLLIAEISDDGSSPDSGNLSDVTHRLVRRILRRDDGMPVRIEERSGDGQLTTATHFHYTPDLLVSKQEVYGSDGELGLSTSFTYNKAGLPLSTTDSIGRTTTFTYDERGRLLSTCKPSGNVETITYNQAGRIIAVEERTPSGKVYSTHSTYNALGFKTSTTDIHGHTTYFTPDPFGKIKNTLHPDGGEEKNSYGAAGLPLQMFSPNGDVTTTTYNAYGKPTQITYPDHTTQTFTYHPDGTLEAHVDGIGTRTQYVYDFLGRLIHQSTFDDQGNLLSEERNEYCGALLMRHVNAEGEITEYEYDNAGRKIAQHQGGATTTWVFDPMGRESIVSTFATDLHKTYDSLGRIVAERASSKEGTLLSDIAYTYDVNDNILTTTRNTLQGDSVISHTYDEWGRALLHIDPLGATTHIEWDETTLQSLRKITTDAAGTQTIETIGPMERITSRELVADGKRLFLTTFTYDKQGNCLEEETFLPTRTLLTKKSYSHGKITELIEANGTPEQKTTRYSYINGLLSEVHKADGITLSYTYDGLSRVATCQASTGEGYSYTYDKLGRVISVTDLLRSLSSTRSYDATGNVWEETFLHGLNVSYERDPLGKPLTLTLPDRSSIHYQWEAGRIRAISRGNNSGDLLYTTSYDHYDLTGNPLAKTTIAGEETYLYDLAGRLSARATPYHKETVWKRNPLGSPLEIRDQFNHLQTQLLYNYDPLQQLTSEWTLFHKHTHQFDAYGAPLMRDEEGCQVNHLNELQKVGEETFTYTPAGNLLSDSTHVYTYDAFDRLTSVEELKQQKAVYIYDSWHRRVQKILFTWQADEWKLFCTRSYFYDGMQEIGSVDEAGNILELRVQAPGVKDETVAIECRGGLYLPLYTSQGHIAGLVDARTKTLIEVYRYSAFGDLQIYDANNQPLPTSCTGNPWRYFGRRMDEESGLTYFGRRYYSPKLGTWTTPDPALNIDHPNLYLFLRNNPLCYSDALGLLACPDNVYQPIAPDIRHHIEFTRADFPIFCNTVGGMIYGVAHCLPVPYVADKMANFGAYLMDSPNKMTTHSSFQTLREGDGQYNCIFGNGMNNSLSEALFTGEALMKKAQLEDAMYVNYRAQHTLMVELLKCGLEYCGVSFHSTRLLEKNLIAINEKAKQKDITSEYNLLLHSAGNFGGKIALTSLKTMHPEINDHTFIYSLGTPVIIDDRIVNYVETQISSNDGVGFLARFQRLLNPSHQKYTLLPSAGGWPLCDHAILGETYGPKVGLIFQNIEQRRMK